MALGIPGNSRELPGIPGYFGNPGSQEAAKPRPPLRTFLVHLSTRFALDNLSAAWDSVNSEILRLEQLEYYSIFKALPFMPICSVPQGSTPRKHEPNRHRRTSDGGSPRDDVFDKAGTPAVSMNAAIGLHSTVEIHSDPSDTSGLVASGSEV